MLEGLLSDGTHFHGWKWVPVVGLLAAPVLPAAAIWCRPLALQLLARSFWWVQLLYASFASLTGLSDRHVRAVALGSACALLAAGRVGLADERGRFRPVAFRGTLTLALILAMADAAAFSWIGVTETIEDGRLRLIFFAPPMIAAVIGLLRLRTWGLLVSVVTNVVVAVVVGAVVRDFSDEGRALFVGNAIVQLLIPLPMWITIIRRRPPPPDRWQKARAIAATFVIVALAVVAIASAQFGAHSRS